MTTVTKPIILDETGIRIAEAIEALDSKVTMTITCTSDQSGVTVTGQTINVYDVQTSLLYKSFVYNGQPVSFEINKGMSYHVVPTVTLAQHYCTDNPAGIADTNVSITLAFHSISGITTFPALKSAVDAGNAKHIPIGWQVSMTFNQVGNWDEGTHLWDVVDYDSTTDTLTLLMHDTMYQQKSLGSAQATYSPSAAMPAGDYTFKVGSTAYYFTTTSEVPANGQVRATTSGFTTYSGPTSATAIETGTVSTTAISGATDLGTTGSGRLNHMDRVNNGGNTFGDSALFQWMNATGEDWWEPVTMFDRPPTYVGDVGMLSGISAADLAAIDDAEWKCVAQSSYAAPDSPYTKGNRYTLNGKFCLASEIEVFGSASFDDGTHQWDAYIDATAAQRIKYYGSSARNWWLRSPHSSASNERIVLSIGSVNNYSATSNYGVVPACKISKSTI